MSTDIAVSVRGLSKAYTIAHNDERHVTLAEQMLHRLRNPFKKAQTETFWALRDVEFDIRKGDVVGIIGRNGAGKSTLLKILSRITEPTAGEIRLYGRVGSLLEVGTGFHPELTGRENVYLNGQILGMRKREIDKQFDAIVDFAGVEKFLDTPVKRYSSGMYVRLAFAVAAHLESEILIVDEVLAVGDTEFQRKCLGKMKDVASGGRTVLFVSHNMAAVEALCTRGLLLHQGTVHRQGPVGEIIDGYQEALIQAAVRSDLRWRKDRSGNGRVRLVDFRLEDPEGRVLQVVRSGQDAVFAFQYECDDVSEIDDLSIGLSLGYGDHNLLSVLYNTYVGQPIDLPGDGGWIKCRVENLPLAVGRYVVGARVVVNSEEADWPRDGVGEMTVEPGGFLWNGSDRPWEWGTVAAAWRLVRGRGAIRFNAVEAITASRARKAMSMTQSLKMMLPRRVRLGFKRAVGSWVRVQDDHATQSFSQEGEDLVINRLLQLGERHAPGFYVDVGAHHPRMCSNTYYFYKRGWRGIKRDAKPGTKALFDSERPRDLNLELGIADSASEMTYFEFDQPLLNGFDRNMAEMRAADPAWRLTGTRQIPVKPLRDVLAEHLPPGQSIDFMTVDVEGLDLQVLRSNDWDRFRPRLLLAEDATVVTLDDARNAPLCQYLASVGYTAIGKAALTMFFVANGHLTQTSVGHKVS